MSCTRRDFLKASLGASTLLSFGASVPVFLGRSALAGASRRDAEGNALVVVQLTGGNDGLNTVVPFRDDHYLRSRPTLRLPANRLHKIDSHLGFHPEMAAFLRLLKDGHLSIIQGVGYPNSSRDHGGALRDWHTARPDEATCQTGWVGRTVDTVHRSDDAGVSGVFVGRIARPFALNAEKAVVPSIPSPEEFTLRTIPGPDGGQTHRRCVVGAAETRRIGPANPLLDFVQRTALDAYASSKRVESAAEDRARGNGADYPEFKLARTFKTIVQLIRAELGIRIYYTELGGGGIGGFDSHANQAENHGALLRQLSESVAAFVDDLRRHGLLDRVLLMTFSEFGRTVAENGRRGTGHGAAAPMFLAGGKLRGGLVGPHPSLDDLDHGAMKFHTDFRRVYGTVLDRWLGIDSREVLGETFEPLDVLRA